jgi:SPP1 gp7 family putative phage head morphogenesis protein
MIALVGRARPAFAPLVAELPRLLARAVAARQDDVGGESEGQRARRLIAEAEERMRAAIRPHDLEALATKFADRTESWQAGELRKQAQAALGVDVYLADKRIPALVDHFVAENVTLIRSIPDEVAIGVGKLVTQAFSAGTSHPELARHIEERFQIGERRARLIARDQIGKLCGQVNASRQRELGVTSFTWRTVGDERVRPEHEDRDGETFRYDDPPDDGLPGEPVCCRCSAEPVFDDILAEADTVDATGPDEPDAEADAVVTPTPEPEPQPEPEPEPEAAASGEGAGNVKNPRRVEAAKKAGAASAERRREIHSAVKSNLHPSLHLAWDKEGHKFLKQQADRIKGIKDRISAASKISEAFTETFGSGEESVHGNEGDRYFARAELEAKHAEAWANDQERAYYEEMRRDALEAGDIDESGELTAQGREKERQALEFEAAAASKETDDDPPF